MIGRPSSSKTLVPMGEFSSTKPSKAVAFISGGLASTGLTVMKSFAVAERFASVTSCAWNSHQKL